VNRVALFLATNLGAHRDILRGVKNYSRSAQPWTFLVAWPEITPPEVIANWKPDGIIAKVLSPRMGAMLGRMRVPLVNITNFTGNPNVPHVAVDENAVGRLAAEHFLERGFKNFAYIGYRQQRRVNDRMAAFEKTLRAAGFGCQTFVDIDFPLFRPGATWGMADKRIRSWLAKLTRPAGVFIYNDYLAWEVLEVCRGIGLHVPEDVALLGTDNDELFADLSHPPLSSIAYPAEKIGFAAAELLDRLMKKKTVPRAPILIPPIGVVTRQSSDIVAIEDPDLAIAVRYIRANACQPMAVKTILREVSVSRRSLEQKFRRALGRTPHEEIARVRIEQARQLLTHTDLSMPEIARRSGFSNAERLSVVFKYKTGFSPTSYRKKFQ
jgi:LacI family transcriptional regulator